MVDLMLLVIGVARAGRRVSRRTVVAIQIASYRLMRNVSEVCPQADGETVNDLSKYCRRVVTREQDGNDGMESRSSQITSKVRQRRVEKKKEIGLTPHWHGGM